MEQIVAETVAQGTRDEAQRQARDDLATMRREAVDAGRDRSRKIIKVTLINTSTGEIAFNPAGRLLRDWYLHVYINRLRANLDRPCEVIDSEELDKTASLLRQVRPIVASLQAQEAAQTTYMIAVSDAAAAAACISETAHGVSAARAIQHAPDDRFDGDLLRVHVTRHWYQRCYENWVDEAVSARHPLAQVTGAEEFQVARTLTTREVRRLIGSDGIPLVSALGAAMSSVDRELATARISIEGPSVTVPTGELIDALALRVGQAWDDLAEDPRERWLQISGGSPIGTAREWATLDSGRQLTLIQQYLATYGRSVLDIESGVPRIDGTPGAVAQKMFSHVMPLVSSRGVSDREMSSQLDVRGGDPLGEARSVVGSVEEYDAGPTRRSR